MRRKTIFLFNGPPGCGKDEACATIMRLDQETIYAYYKEWLYEESAKSLGFTFEAWSKICQDTVLKDTPFLLRTDKASTPRELLIEIAEKRLKLQLGRNCIAVKMAERLKEKVKGLNHYTVAVPDLGFPEELTTLQEYFPDANIVLVHIYRNGYSFKGDSRNYIGSPDVVFHNNGPLVEFQIRVSRLYRESVHLFN